MAEVQRPIVPSRLYRYRSLSRRATATAEEISSIREQYLYCANFSTMNDPMEGIYRSSKLLRATPSYRDTIRQIRDIKSGLGVAAFSETYDNMIMWAHYADNCEGICFGYSSTDLIKGLPDDAAVVRVAYLDNPPTISKTHAKHAENAARRILSQKQFNWAYEREWRVLANVGRVFYAPEQALREVYFGSRISEAQRKLILSAVGGMRDIKVYDMDLNGYTPYWEPVNLPTPKVPKKKKRA